MKGTTVSKRKLEVHTDASLMKKLHKGPMELHAGYSSNDWPGRKSCGTSVSSSAACLGTRRQKGTSGAAEEHGNTANEKVLKVIQASSKGDSQHPAGSQGGIDDDNFPCDTLVALRILLLRFPSLPQVCLGPFALRSQLYPTVTDRSCVDQQLEALKHANTVRVFHLTTGADDQALMLMSAYRRQVEIAEQQMETKHPPKVTAVFPRFLSHVVMRRASEGITHRELIDLLGGGEGWEVEDSHVTALIQAGLLVRQGMNSDYFYFAMPNVGRHLRMVVQGRRELMGFCSRRKRGEILRYDLMGRRLLTSQLGMDFHLRDLLGTGLLRSEECTLGSVIRVASII